MNFRKINTPLFSLALFSIVFLVVSSGLKPARAEEIRAAVSSNFISPMEKIVILFHEKTGHNVKVSFGSSGKLFSLIKLGAPFDIFLSADDSLFEKLKNENLVIARTFVVYAEGRLVLWSPKQNFVDIEGKVLESNAVKKIAIGNPRLAPYGKAARETLENMNLWKSIQKKIVTGENIAQAYQFADSENAQLAFISLSQIMKNGEVTHGSFWLIPQKFYTKIQQSAMILSKARNKKTADEFLKFLKNPECAAIIRAYGYEIP